MIISLTACYPKSLGLGARASSKYTRGGGSNARLGGRELTLLCGFNQYTPLQNRDNSGLLGTPVYYSIKLGGGGRCPPNAQVGGGGRPPPCPPCGAPPVYSSKRKYHAWYGTHYYPLIVCFWSLRLYC